jgi:hypothetical protein
MYMLEDEIQIYRECIFTNVESVVRDQSNLYHILVHQAVAC